MTRYTPDQLGWKPFFQQQLTLAELEQVSIARVIGVERSQLAVLTLDGEKTLPSTQRMPGIAVGDWLLLDGEGRFHRLLERASLFSRRAPGTAVATQLIAANLDSVFIVSSMNLEFKLNRIERYLALANEARVEPVIVLTRLDLCDDPDAYRGRVQALHGLAQVVLVNSLDAQSVAQLAAWCGPGRTVALLGSSGVGKSTIVNTLQGSPAQATRAVRAGDHKGRHTTTRRSLHFLPAGGMILDTPGMRELQLADCEQGVEDTFGELVEYATRCRFSDCAHESEPGCAVREAIEAGLLDARRLASYRKLMREQAFNSASLAEKRARDRAFGRYARSVMAGKRKTRDG